MKVEAVHTIQHQPDPNGPIVREKPGSQFDLAERDEWMLKTGAVKAVEGETAAPKGKRSKKSDDETGANGSDLVG